MRTPAIYVRPVGAREEEREPLRARRSPLLLVLVASLLLSAALADAAQAQAVRITSERRVTARVIELTIATPAFPAPTKVDVDLPTGYDAQPSRRWPVTYFTAGTMNRYDAFNKFVEGEKLAANYPSIIVSPDANSGYWSDWYNGGALGPPEYETFVTRQLIPLIEARFRTIPDRSHRAIFGISMGGYGSMMLAARHPDLFVAAASLSGAVDSNLAANGAVLSASSTFDGAPADAIYGPRASQEVRWRGHNPLDLAPNLRDLNLQIRTANGVPNPAIGEGSGSGDVPSCVIETGVHEASVDLHEQFDAFRIAHAWRDYGAGCHTPPNFTREIADTLAAFTPVLARPPAPPATFDYRSIEPRFDIWGWHLDADPSRALEFLRVRAGRSGITLDGSGRTTVVTPAWYRGLKAVDVNGRPTRPTPGGRLRFGADLGAADTGQQYTPGATTTVRSRRVSLAPHAVVRIKAKRVGRRLRVCLRAIGGDVPRARIRAAGRSARVKIGAKTRCRVLHVRRRSPSVTVRGRDRFGHLVRARATVRKPHRARHHARRAVAPS
jgi:S-formylglutathione hydrolase FrmB